MYIYVEFSGEVLMQEEAKTCRLVENLSLTTQLANFTAMLLKYAFV